VTVLVLVLAGSIHLVLIPEHFAEQVLYGLVFTALALFQLSLTLLLATVLLFWQRWRQLAHSTQHAASRLSTDALSVSMARRQ
jgi:hypothetical protein